MGLSNDAKERFGTVFEVVKTIFHWSFIPGVLYLGFKKGPEVGMPEFTVLSLLWQ